MFRLSIRSKFFCTLFGLITAAALAHDLYIWNRDDVYPNGELGAILKRYLPDQFQIAVDFIGADFFNKIFTPIFSTPAVYIAGGLFLMSLTIGLLMARFGYLLTGREPPKPIKKDKKIEYRTYKDRVKYKRQ